MSDAVNAESMIWFGEYSFDKSEFSKLIEARELGYLSPTIPIEQLDIEDDRGDYMIVTSDTVYKVLEDRQGIVGKKGKDLRAELEDLFSDQGSEVLDESNDCGQLYSHLLEYEEILEQIEVFQKEFGQSFFKYDDLDKLTHGSIDLKSIPRVKPIAVTLCTKCNEFRKSRMIVVSGVHGNEWLSIHSAMEFLKHVVKLFSDNLKDENHFTHQLELIIVPVANPDGYRYSRSGDCDWRKNLYRVKKGDEEYCGVDLNRNYPVYFAWNAQTHGKDALYHGVSPISEPEAASLRKLLKENDDCKLLIDLHCGKTMGLYHPRTEPRFGRPLTESMRSVSNSDKRKYGQLERAFMREVSRRDGYIVEERGPSSGTFDEYAYHVFGIPSVSIEVFEKKRRINTDVRDETILKTNRYLESLIRLSLII